MATVSEMRKHLLEDYKNANKKFADAADIKRVKSLIEAKSREDLTRVYNNSLWMKSSASDRYVEKEVRKMDKAGMFNVSKLAPKHALD